MKNAPQEETALARSRRLKKADEYRDRLVRRSITAGAEAPPGTRCPYLMSDLLRRHAWLAGHYDAHGYAAWDLARRTADADNLEEDLC